MDPITTNITTRRTKAPKLQVLQQALVQPYALVRTLNNRSFYRFVKYFWGEISNTAFQTNWHIEYICDILQKSAERVGENLPKEHDIIINVPPGTSKTSIVSVLFPVWCWTRWYWMQFITVSYSSSLSLESAEKSRDLIRSDRFQAIYPELEIKDDKDRIGNFRVSKKVQYAVGRVPRVFHGGNRFSTSIGATVTGFHGHFLIWDDPLNPEQAHSKVQLETANRWIEQTLSTRKIDKQVSVTIGIMQRLHEDDVTGHLLSKPSLKIRHICLPGEILHYRDQVQPQSLVARYVDGLLDPVRLPLSALEELETRLGQYGYAGQVGQRPTAPGGGMFKVDHFQYMDRLPEWKEFIHTVRYWDKAGTKEQAGTSACYTVGVKMSLLTGNRILVWDVKRGRWSSEEREEIILQTARADGRGVFIFHEQEPGSGGKQSAEMTDQNLIGFSSRADLPHGDKIYRADPLSVQVNRGNVYLLRGEWNREFIEEYRYFPRSKFKDQVDAGSGAFDKLTHQRVARAL